MDRADASSTSWTPFSQLIRCPPKRVKSTVGRLSTALPTGPFALGSVTPTMRSLHTSLPQTVIPRAENLVRFRAMFGWVGATYARPILVACLLLAVVFLATGLVLGFVTVAETEVHTAAVSEADQFSEAGPGPPVGALGAPGPGRAHQVTTVEAQSGFSPASTDVDVPRLAWSPTARLSIHSSNPGDLTVTQPAPSPNAGDGSHAVIAPTDTGPHEPTNREDGFVSPTSHSGVGGSGSDAAAPGIADGSDVRSGPSFKSTESSNADGSFAARLHRRVTGIADAPAIGIAVGGIGGPVLEAHDRHEEIRQRRCLERDFARSNKLRSEPCQLHTRPAGRAELAQVPGSESQREEAVA